MTDRLLSLLREAWEGDQQAIASVYAESVRVHGILGQLQGRAHLAQFLQRCLEAFPDPQISLHEAFADATGHRLALRHRLIWQHLGTGFGQAPTGQRGILELTSMLRVQDSKVTEQVLGFTTFGLEDGLSASGR